MPSVPLLLSQLVQLQTAGFEAAHFLSDEQMDCVASSSPRLAHAFVVFLIQLKC